MLEKQNKIIIVDNVPEQLEILAKSFFKNGLGCRTFEYDLSYDSPLKGIRIAFFDINLTEKTVDANYETHEQILERNTSVFNDLALALNQYIAKENGPYVLIFWTANSKIVEAFKLYMRNPERGYSDTASPILIECIDKTPFAEQQNQNSLSDRVLKLLNDNEKIKFLFDLEDNAKVAGEKTLNRLYDILPKDAIWGESSQLFDNLDRVLSKIAASTLGFAHAKENPKRGIYEGLLPVISYEFLNTESNTNWNQIVSQLNSAKKYSDISSPDDTIQYKVNSLYHIETYSNQSKDVRGCTIEIDKNSKVILQSFNIDDVNDWISKLIAIKDSNAAQKERKNAILDNAQLIAVEVSAACDYSNRKQRINKYILGALTSNLNANIEDDLNIKNRPEASYHLGGCCFHHNNNNYHIWLNLNYVFGANPNDTRLGTPLFLLKKEIMDMLGNKYASHVSRIGITSF